MKAEDVKERLQAQFAGHHQAILFEVGDGLGRGRKTARVADAIGINFWESRGLDVSGFEIKVQRGDWLREVQMPGKGNAHFVRCDRWWLVTPARRASETPIAKPSEIPGPWGWMEVQKTGDAIVRKEAPKLVPSVPFDRAFAFSLIKAAARYDKDAVTAEVRRRMGEFETNFTQRVNAQAAQLAQPHKDHVDEPLMAALREAFGPRIRWLAKEKVVAAIQAWMQVRDTRLDRMTDVAKSLREAADKLERAAGAVEALTGED